MQQLTATVRKALAELKITPTDLSRRLGRSDNYIQMMLKGCTTKKQNELISMIDQVLKGEVFKGDDDIIAELSEKLAHSQDTNTQITSRLGQATNKILNLEGSLLEANENWSLWQRKHNQTQILLNQSEENSLYWMAKVPTTRWGAFKLFVKLLITGKN